MAFLEAEKGIGARLLELGSGWFRDQVMERDGLASLILAEGGRAAVSFRLSVKRSYFSVSGGGCFHCRDEDMYKAIVSSQWLALEFDDAETVDISVYKIQSIDGTLRCWFEVHS